jgi:predicted 3-demethylubiquinone-9 3-methyltransferase (glyoxalase superfamily)
MQKITPFLRFNDNAEEAANMYTRLFADGKITSILKYPESMPGMGGKVMTVGFELFGQHFTALNGGPQFKFTEAVSFVVHCKNQEEVDKYWNALLEGGEPQACGWLKDKYGLSWQIVPDALLELMQDKDKERSGRVMQAMMKMIRIDILTLQKAYNGEQ